MLGIKPWPVEPVPILHNPWGKRGPGPLGSSLLVTQYKQLCPPGAWREDAAAGGTWVQGRAKR